MFADATVTELVDLGDESVKKVAVVTNHDEGAIEVLQGLFKNVFGAEVEVVCWLVEDEEVHWFEEEFEYSESCALATGQHFHFFRGVFASEHKGSEQVAYLIAYLPLCNIINGLENGKFTVEQGCLVLSEVANLYVVSEVELSLVLELSHDALDECRLSFAVATYEGYLVATFYGEVHTAEYCFVIESHGYVAHLHGVGTASWAWWEL